jgi:hypothetical protein
LHTEDDIGDSRQRSTSSEGTAGDDQAAGATATRAPTPGARPRLVWWKRLTTSDAHRKPPTSHQRNYVALSKAGHEIDWHTWFREELFGDEDWLPEPMRNGGTKEVAFIAFDVWIEDRSIGRYDLVIDHAEGRIAGQNNTPTYLNWSSMLPVIKAHDYRGWWLELARLADGSYRLRLTQSEPSY